MQRTTLFAGDDDFIPLVEALVREGMTVTIWHPSQASEALLAAADNRRAFDLKSSFSLLTRDGLTPMFSHIRSGGGFRDPTKGEHTHSWIDPVWKYLGKWETDELTIWRSSNDVHWEFHTYKAPRAPLSQVLELFGLVTGWNVSAQTLAKFE